VMTNQRERMSSRSICVEGGSDLEVVR